MKMKTEETIKLIKYVTGSVAAVLLAAALQLQFAYAAGIITLLTIQDTKKETVRITAKRMIIFVIMTILSAVILWSGSAAAFRMRSPARRPRTC